MSKQLKEIKLLGDGILVKFVDVPITKKKSKIIVPDVAKHKEDSMLNLTKDFGGVHPHLVKVVAISPKVSEEISIGDIAIIRTAVIMNLHQDSEREAKGIPGIIPKVVIEGELYHRLVIGDIIAINNSLKENIKDLVYNHKNK